MVSTAGGVLFKGQVDGNIVAYDAKTGDQLWKFQTGWGISAPPMTYSIDGVQYVAVAAGGNRGGVSTTDGDAVWAFALNGVIDEAPAPPPIQTKTTLGGPLVKLGDPVGRIDTQGLDKPFDGTIDTADYQFTPVRVSVPAGTTLNWSNSGAVIHTATSTQGGWDTGDIPAGGTVAVTFNTAGTLHLQLPAAPVDDRPGRRYLADAPLPSEADAKRQASEGIAARTKQQRQRQRAVLNHRPGQHRTAALARPQIEKPTPAAVARSSGTTLVISSACWSGQPKLARMLRSTKATAATSKIGANNAMTTRHRLPSTCTTSTPRPLPIRRSSHGATTTLASDSTWAAAYHGPSTASSAPKRSLNHNGSNCTATPRPSPNSPSAVP